jgi:hypothetical protein
MDMELPLLNALVEAKERFLKEKEKMRKKMEMEAGQ